MQNSALAYSRCTFSILECVSSTARHHITGIIYFCSAVYFESGCGLQVDGTLIARGDRYHQILFNSSANGTSTYFWKGIHFTSTGNDGNFLSFIIHSFMFVSSFLFFILLSIFLI
jgi:hypothetical protein